MQHMHNASLDLQRVFICPKCTVNGCAVPANNSTVCELNVKCLLESSVCTFMSDKALRKPVDLTTKCFLRTLLETGARVVKRPNRRSVSLEWNAHWCGGVLPHFRRRSARARVARGKRKYKKARATSRPGRRKKTAERKGRAVLVGRQRPGGQQLSKGPGRAPTPEGPRYDTFPAPDAQQTSGSLCRYLVHSTPGACLAALKSPRRTLARRHRHTGTREPSERFESSA